MIIRRDGCDSGNVGGGPLSQGILRPPASGGFRHHHRLRKPLREDNGLRSAATFPGALKWILLVQQESLDGSNDYATGP